MIQLILCTGLIFCSTDSLKTPMKISDRIFSFTPKLFHHPQRVLFNSRTFDLEVFSDFPRDSVQSISLFYKTDMVRDIRKFHLILIKKDSLIAITLESNQQIKLPIFLQ
jgi:hypothetical protein